MILMILWVILVFVSVCTFLPSDHAEVGMPLIMLGCAIGALGIFGLSTTLEIETVTTDQLYSYEQGSPEFVIGTYDDFSVFRDEAGEPVVIMTDRVSFGSTETCTRTSEVTTIRPGLGKLFFDTSGLETSIETPRNVLIKRVIF